MKMPKIDIIKPYNSEKPVNYKFTSQICTTSCSSSDPGLDRSQTAKCKKKSGCSRHSHVIPSLQRVM